MNFRNFSWKFQKKSYQSFEVENGRIRSRPLIHGSHDDLETKWKGGWRRNATVLKRKRGVDFLTFGNFSFDAFE